MKIVAHSNFDIESVDDILVAENISNEYWGNRMLDALKATVSGRSPYYFKLVPDDYKLYVWEP